MTKVRLIAYPTGTLLGHLNRVPPFNRYAVFPLGFRQHFFFFLYLILSGKPIGFLLALSVWVILPNIQSKPIQLARKCQQKIHKGTYDGMALREFYDPVIAEI